MQNLTAAAGAAWSALEVRTAPPAEVRFNPNHAPAGAGGGEFTTGGGAGGKAAKAKQPKKTPKRKLPAQQPNGLGYSAAQWAQLQQLEADAKAGKKLDAHDKHLLHVAHTKHEAALKAEQKSHNGRQSARRPAAAKAAPKKAAAPKAPVLKGLRDKVQAV